MRFGRAFQTVAIVAVVGVIAWLADCVVRVRATSVCTTCFSTMETQFLAIAPSSPFAAPGSRVAITWRWSEAFKVSPAGETLFATDHSHSWLLASRTLSRYLRSSAVVPTYGVGLPVSQFAARFNAEPEFRAFLAGKVASGQLSSPELREVFRSSIHFVTERGVTAERLAFRHRAEALLAEFSLAHPSRT